MKLHAIELPGPLGLNVIIPRLVILVGASVFKSVGQIAFSKIEEGLPAFLTIILIPLTFSITQGILWGFMSHVGLNLIVGRRREIHPVTYALAAICTIRSIVAKIRLLSEARRS